MYDTSCARFASGMSVALKSGLDTEEGFDLVTQLVDDPDFCQKIASAREAIQNGEDFSDALNKAGIFSGIDARMVSVGFRAGAADSALSDIASRLQTETDEKLQSLAGLLEPHAGGCPFCLGGTDPALRHASAGKCNVKHRIRPVWKGRILL